MWLLNTEAIDSDALCWFSVRGFSLGGHILLKFLGELGANAPPFLVNSIAVCAAIEPADSVRLFGLPKNKLFQD